MNLYGLTVISLLAHTHNTALTCYLSNHSYFLGVYWHNKPTQDVEKHLQLSSHRRSRRVNFHHFEISTVSRVHFLYWKAILTSDRDNLGRIIFKYVNKHEC